MEIKYLKISFCYVGKRNVNCAADLILVMIFTNFVSKNSGNGQLA